MRFGAVIAKHLFVLRQCEEKSLQWGLVKRDGKHELNIYEQGGLFHAVFVLPTNFNSVLMRML